MFRKLTLEDWADFASLEKEAFAEDAINKQNFQKIVNSDKEKERFVGLFKENKLVGYIYIRILVSIGRINRIAVKKKHWGKGYGKKLMEFSLDFFSKKSLQLVDLYVETDNERAIGLYKRYGFVKEIESYHFIVEKNKLKQIEQQKYDFSDMLIKKLGEQDLTEIRASFPEGHENEIKERLGRDDYVNLGLYIEDELVIYGALSPSFSGMKPFLCKKPEYLEPFLMLLRPYRIKPYIRLTFDNNYELFEHCKKQGYKLWHHLYIMEKKLQIH